MRIVIVHNFYQQSGGEDQVFAAETELLRTRGHDVVTYTVHNDRVDNMSHPEVAARTLWNSASYRELAELVGDHSASVVHFHNTLPLVSPAGYYAARAKGAAVVQTLHNYRLICPGSLLYRAGAVCETCVSKRVKWPAVKHGCYRDSRAATGAVTAMLATHDAAGTYRKAVDAYVALSPSARELFVRGGLPEDRVYVKPNFLLRDPGTGSGNGGYALFVGRLSPEKGIDVLIEGWKKLTLDMPLKIAGDGPLADRVAHAASADHRIEVLGRVTSDAVYELMQNASLLVFPSTWYEGMPITLIEALACGTPVLAANFGAMADMVEDGVTGFHFAPGSAGDLAAAAERALLGSTSAFRARARRAFENHYTADHNYRILLQIYEAATARAGVEPDRKAA